MSQRYGKARTCKLHEATQMYVMVDYVGEMTVKKSCKYGRHLSCGHLLSLLVYFFFENFSIDLVK